MDEHHSCEKTREIKTTEKEERSTRPSWREVVANPKPANNISEEMLRKIKKMRQALILNKCMETRTPKVEAFYFKNIRRSPLGKLRAGLRESLPPWALLGLSFVGGSVLEILCDQRLQHQLIATLKIAGIQNIKSFNIMNDGLKKESAHRKSVLNNLKAARKRLEHCANKSRNAFAKEWYTDKEERVKSEIQRIEG